MFDFKYFYILEAAQFEPKEILTKANFSDEQADDLIKKLTAIILPYGEIDKSAKKLKYLYPLAAFLTNPNVTIDQVKTVFDQYMSNEKARNNNLIYKINIYDHVNMRGDFNAFQNSIAEQDKKAEPQQAQKEISAEDKKQGNIRKAKQIITLNSYNDYLEKEGLPKKERMDRDDYLKVKENKIEFSINYQLSTIEKAIAKYPDDEHTIDASYMVPLAKFLAQIGRPLDVFNTFDEYMSIDRLKNEKTIFKHDDFTKFVGEVHQEISSTLSLKKLKSSKMDESEAVYVDKNIAVYCGTTEDIFESIQRCIKFGQGNKYGLCIASKSHNWYTHYRFTNSTTTYFAYFKDPNIHNPNFIIIDALKNPENPINIPGYNNPYAQQEEQDDVDDGYDDRPYDNDLDTEYPSEPPPVENKPKPTRSGFVTADKYSWNPIIPNEDNEISKQKLLSQFPALRDAFTNDVFKVLPITESEKEVKKKFYGKELSEFTNIKDKLELIRFEHKSDFTEHEEIYLNDDVSPQEAELLLKEILINRPELNARTIRVYKKHPSLYEKYLKGALDDAEIEINGQQADNEQNQDDEDGPEWGGLNFKVEYAEAYKPYPEMFKRYFSLLAPYQLEYPNQMMDMQKVFKWYPEADDLINYDYFFKTDNKAKDLHQAFRYMRDKDLDYDFRENSPKAYNYLKGVLDDLKAEHYDIIVNNFRERIELSERRHGKKHWVFGFSNLVECPNFEDIIKVNNFTPEEILKLSKASIYFTECYFDDTKPLASLDSLGRVSFEKCTNNFYYLPKKLLSLHIKEYRNPIFFDTLGFRSKSKIRDVEIVSSRAVDFRDTDPSIKNITIEDSSFENFIGLPPKLTTLEFIQKHVGQSYNKAPSFEGIPKIVDNLIIRFAGNQTDIDKLGLDKFRPQSFNKGTNRLDGRSSFNNMRLEEYAKKKLESTPTNESFGGFLKTKSFLFEDLYKRMG